MKVVLYRVGRNLNRAYRTAEAFGVSEIVLVECSASLTGNLFRAKDRVILSKADVLPAQNTVAFETFYNDAISTTDWGSVNFIVIGGETSGLPRSIRFEQMVKIPTVGHVSGLTVEAALAIALYEWRKYYDSHTRT